jgi:RNA polymerase sigma factor (sigma-70 family)
VEALAPTISYRRSARLRSVAELLRRLGRPAPSNDPAHVATRPDVLTALRAIPPKLAAAIVLRHYHGYNNREIALALGVSERTVGSRLSQAATRLRVLLQESPGPAFSLGASAALSSEQEASSHADH